MPQVGIRYAGQEYTWEEARTMAENPAFPFPPPLIEAMADVRGDDTPTASVITGCLRQFELKRKMNYFAEAGGELSPIFGTAFHDHMDMYRKRIMQPGDLAETRLTAMVDVGIQVPGGGTEIAFSGKMDFMRPGVLVSDWKSKNYIPQGFKPPSAHIGQVNIYNWLGTQNGLKAAPLWELTYISQSWVQREQGPTSPVKEIGEYVRGRLRAWAASAVRGQLPDPVPEVFESDAKGKALPPCAWCPVREACISHLKQGGQRPF